MSSHLETPDNIVGYMLLAFGSFAEERNRPRAWRSLLARSREEVLPGHAQLPKISAHLTSSSILRTLNWDAFVKGSVDAPEPRALTSSSTGSAACRRTRRGKQCLSAKCEIPNGLLRLLWRHRVTASHRSLDYKEGRDLSGRASPRPSPAPSPAPRARSVRVEKKIRELTFHEPSSSFKHQHNPLNQLCNLGSQQLLLVHVRISEM